MPSDEHLLALEDYTKCNRPLPYCRAGSLIRSGILPWMNSFWATLIVVHMTPWSRCADFAFLRIGIDRTSSCNLKAESSLSFPVQSFEYVICGNLNQPGPVPWFGVPLAIPINLISPLKAWHARDDWTTGPVWTDDPRRREVWPHEQRHSSRLGWSFDTAINSLFLAHRPWPSFCFLYHLQPSVLF